MRTSTRAGWALAGLLTPQTGFGGPPYVPVDQDGMPQFTPKLRPPQIDALSESTTLVTVGIGGNQYNVGQIVAKCAALGASSLGSPGTDFYRGTEEGREDLVRKESDLRDGFAKLMPELRERAPGAKFFFVGYPTLFPSTPDGQRSCDSGLDENITIKKGDMAFIQEQFALVDSIAREAATSRGHTFVDVAESSRDHHVCREGNDKWMFGLYASYPFAGTPGYKPARFPAGAEMLPFTPGWTAWMQGLLANGDGIFRGNETLTTFHPNKRGADNQTAQVTNALRAAGIV